MSDTEDDTAPTPQEGQEGDASGQPDETLPSDDGMLDQAEIDGLLDISMDDGQPATGFDALIGSARIPHRRMPLLNACFDRLATGLSGSLRSLTGEHVELSIAESTSVRFGDYVDAIPMPALMAVFEAVEWRGQGLITLDSPLIYSIIDVLLGGRRASAPLEIEGRSFTPIEAALIERMIRLILDDLSTAFEPLYEVCFRHERLESNPGLVSIVHPSATAVVFRIDVDMDDRGGRIEILIPDVTLESVRSGLQQVFMGDKFGQDVIWEDHWLREMRLAETEIEVSLGCQTMELNELTSLEVGSVLRLNTKPEDMVLLTCGQVPLMRGRVGRVGETMAIEIDNWIDPSKRQVFKRRSE